MFENYTCIEDYQNDGLIPVEPMTAEEISVEDLDEILESKDFYAEEKFDGTRATLHFWKGKIRVFSRRISKKTGWYVENSDSLPHIRDINIPELEGTILDGEMFIPNRPFKDVASTLNCLPEKAIERQNELGYVVFHAFDILYYKGVKIENVPLYRRKEYLKKVVEKINSPYIKLVYYFDDYISVTLTEKIINDFKNNKLLKYPNLALSVKECLKSKTPFKLDKKTYYEYVVYNGGEGLILKNKNGKYYHKRGREYLKLKKFLTRELIVVGYNQPTKEYNGKLPDTWQYWEYDNRIYVGNKPHYSAIPISKFYAMNWIGTIRFGIIITEQELKEWKNRTKENPILHNINGNLVLELGECSGIDEELRAEISKNPEQFIGSVVEVKAQEVIPKTGRLRHPRFLRFRFDKEMERCVWNEYINQ